MFHDWQQRRNPETIPSSLMPVTRARLILGALMVLLILALSPFSYPPVRRTPSAGAGDASLHLATIDRIRGGQEYYEAVGEELRRRNLYCL